MALVGEVAVVVGEAAVVTVDQDTVLDPDMVREVVVEGLPVVDMDMVAAAEEVVVREVVRALAMGLGKALDMEEVSVELVDMEVEEEAVVAKVVVPVAMGMDLVRATAQAMALAVL
ncbi:hypothetical protein GUJ93_ZPchr0012g21440 [Zizania palustris]|uniref:Uncharacterized protein n=1 Tax=Zizania palustris TaxID=103762 RepID=A0A8J5WHJ3_ZIZPA|nr:hypothetical protein GUJ93_ZPchr0012g21440 [Zizania palustris]